MRYSVKKWDFTPLYFAQKCLQNVGNAVSETKIQIFPAGACAWTTQLEMCHHNSRHS